MTIEEVQISRDKWLDFWKYYEEDPGQQRGVLTLYDHINQVDPTLLANNAAWIDEYRNKVGSPAAKPPSKGLTNPLQVPYDSQLDNPSGEGWRECFSSSCAMAAMYWGVIQHQDEYHAIRPKFGDSTDPSAQIRCLQSLGLDARFVQVGSVDTLKAQIDRGRPTPVGFLHHGTSAAPSGGGHYILAIGYTDTHLIAHDPYGELDVVFGGYPKTGGTYGKEISYSWKNWTPRWSVANDHDGWGLDIWLPGSELPPVQGEQPSANLGPSAPSTGVMSPEGIQLLKDFEGCETTAYPDPGTGGDPWTICVGHTGPEVHPGMTVSMAVCNDYLRKDLEKFEAAVRKLIAVPLTQYEFDAIVSFTFNVGAGALESSTFRKRMNAGEHKAVCFKEEFPKWVNGANGPLPGLVRRRDEEVKHALT